MTFLPWIAGCLGVSLAAGVLERCLLGSARRAIPIRIHVNGTRGKSTVTRLIAAALRAHDVPTLAKVTGTAARLIFPDGSERPVRRYGQANIREQARLLLLARRRGAQALVAECMAVRPELQWAAEHEMIRASHGVITNVRTDHTETMGRTLAEVARSLANTVPRRGTLVLGEPAFRGLFREQCEALGTTLLVAGPAESDSVIMGMRTIPRWLRADIAAALAVTRELGVPDQVALPAMAVATPDPGASRIYTAAGPTGQVRVLDARAANDPESFTALLAEAKSEAPAAGPILVVYNHRSDRPGRLQVFTDLLAARTGLQVVLTGDRPALSLRRALERRLRERWLGFVSRQRLSQRLATGAGRSRLVVLCGNARGLDPATVEAFARG